MIFTGPRCKDEEDLSAVLACDAVPLSGFEGEQCTRLSLNDARSRLDVR